MSTRQQRHQQRKNSKREKQKRRLKNRDHRKKGRKSVPLSPLMMEVLELNRKIFVKKFGRDPRPDEPLFFDPDDPGPEPVPFPLEKLEQEHSLMIDCLEALGAHPAVCYAARKCDFIVNTKSVHWIDDSQVDDWQNAIREWEQKTGEEATEMYFDADLVEGLLRT